MRDTLEKLVRMRPVVWAGGAIAAAGIAAYSDSLTGAPLFDDRESILENPTLRHLGRLGEVLTPALGGGVTVNGRPILNLSLALNYAVSGTHLWSYHAANLLIHVLAGLALFGIARRTLEFLPSFRDRSPVFLGFAIGLLWEVHPLTTQAVSYTIQRAESLMGLFYLLTLYLFVRAVSAGDPGAGETDRVSPQESRVRIRPSLYYCLSICSCGLGMATKEVMATAPILVLLYDRIFVAGSFTECWRKRRGYYAGLAATWILLAALVAANGGNRGGTVGFGSGVGWAAYALTQFEAVGRYLRLSVWPHPLVFEYGTFWVKSAGQALPWALLVAPLILGTVVALFRRPALGFLGAWFFGILAPSSLMPGTTQMVVEYRAYLSVAAVVALGVIGVDRMVGRRSRGFEVGIIAAVAVVFGGLTFRRNAVYRDGLALWSDTAAKRPANAIAQYNLGYALDAAGKLPEAMERFVLAWKLRPDLPETHFNLAVALFEGGKAAEAVAQYREALRLRPDYPQAQTNLGIALASLGRLDEAVACYQDVLRLHPGDARAEDSLGNACRLLNRLPEAAAHYAAAVRIDPESAIAQDNLATALAQLGRASEALEHWEAAARIAPDLADAQAKLADGLMEAGRAPEAVAHYEAALRSAPGSAEILANLGMALAATGRLDDAVARYQGALRIDPQLAEARFNLGNALARMGRLPEAAEEFRAVLRLRPDDADARTRLELIEKTLAAGPR